MNKFQIIEAIQAVTAILLPNYGTLLFYMQFGIHSPNVYDDLIVPSWTPSFLTYKLIWTSSYCIIGYASFLVLKEISVYNETKSKTAKVVLILFYTTHIPACWAWLPLLVGLKSIGGGVVVLILAGSSAFAIMPMTCYVNKIAAVLFIPHIIWIVFLTAWTLKVC